MIANVFFFLFPLASSPLMLAVCVPLHPPTYSVTAEMTKQCKQEKQVEQQHTADQCEVFPLTLMLIS